MDLSVEKPAVDHQICKYDGAYKALTSEDSSESCASTSNETVMLPDKDKKKEECKEMSS